MTTQSSTLNQEIPVGCGCPACQSGHVNNDPVLGDNNDVITDDSYAPTTNGSTAVMVDQLVNGYWTSNSSIARQWAQSEVTYSLGNGYTSAEKASFRMAFDMWADLADITFSEVSSNADMTIVEGSNGSAYSSSSVYTSTGNIASNTISIDTDTSSWSDLTTIGRYGIQTILHEIGHSLGLGHQGNYNGSVDYDNDVVYLNDNRQYSIMSYNNANLIGADHWGQSGVWKYAATPLLYDIAAIQQIYGANTTTRSGATTYGFNSTAGRSQYDLSTNDAPFAIWDGGGTDTLDLSGYSTNQTITLVAGDFTSAGYMTNNIVIAYNTVIENAVGGSGNDTIYGNTANNILTGNAGNDTFYTSTGNDTITGGNGTDTVNYSTNISNFFFSLINSTTVSVLDTVGSYGTDLISTVENFVFNSVNYTWAQIQALAQPLTEYDFAFKVNGNNVFNTSADSIGTTYVTAADIGYSGASGNMARLTRTVDDLTITIQNTSAPNNFVLYGKAGADDIKLEGTHSNFSVVYNGYDGNDTLAISSLIGNDLLYGGNGDDTISAGNGNDKVYGQADNDTINGNAGNDVLLGGSGNDEVNGGDGDDYLYGEDGVDTLNGGNDNDRLWGGAGADTLNGNQGNDIIYGGTENDIINGGAGEDYLIGDAGDDTINGEGDSDTIIGGAGIDTITGGAGVDKIYGQAGNDDIDGGSENDFITGDGGDDTIRGGTGNDKIYGYADNDTLYGDNGADIILGGTGTDTIYGGEGLDQLHGEAGADTIHGGSEKDKIYGGGGDDILNGDAGNDILYGGTENDTLNGGTGDDYLIAEAGNDTLYFADGIDRLYGGAGADTFHGQNSADNDNDMALVYDFSTVDGDRINISDLLTGYNSGTDDLSDFVNIAQGANTTIQIDRDGAGSTYGWDNVLRLLGNNTLNTDADQLVIDGTLIV